MLAREYAQSQGISLAAARKRLQRQRLSSASSVDSDKASSVDKIAELESRIRELQLENANLRADCVALHQEVDELRDELGQSGDSGEDGYEVVYDWNEQPRASKRK